MPRESAHETVDRLLLLNEQQSARIVDLGNRLAAAEAGKDRLLKACEAVETRLLWMAKRYAEAGGTHGVEMNDYNEVTSQLSEAMRFARGGR